MIHRKMTVKMMMMSCSNPRKLTERIGMYIVKKANKRLTSKLFKNGFASYEQARNAVRKYLRSLGLDRNLNTNAISIVKA